MERNQDRTEPIAPAQRSAARLSAAGIAIVAGAFCLTVAVLLTVNFFESRPERWAAPADKNPLYSQELAELKRRLAENPIDDALREEIRSFDLGVRQEFFRRQDFSQRGKVLLFTGLALLLLALKRLVSLGKKTPLPGDGLVDNPVETRRKAASRFSVGAVGLCVAGSALGLLLMPPLELAPPDRQEPGMNPTAAGQTSGAGRSEATAEEIARNWSRFRGPGGLGIAAFDALPAGWDAADGSGVLWKSEVPRPGFNSPIVWDDRAFLSGADETGQEVFCYHAGTGDLLWRRPVAVGPSAQEADLEIWEETGYAASTMACNAGQVFAIFATGDLACFDFEGNALWDKSLGTPDNAYGFATSLLTYKDTLIVEYDQGVPDDDLSILFAVEGATGKRVWQRIRPTASSWTTPVIVEREEGDLLITCTDPFVIAHDPATGREIWRADLMGADVAPSPVASRGLVYTVAPNDAVYALPLGAEGEVTEDDLAWIIDEHVPDICSPLCTEDLLFLLTTMGTLACFETENGTLIWEQDLDGEVNTSPSLVGGTLFVVSIEGRMIAVDAAREFVERGSAELGESTWCSPAFVQGRMYIRGETHLFCFGGSE